MGNIQPGSFGDLLAVAITSITLVVTVILVIIGFRIGANIKSFSDRIDELGKQKTAHSREFRGLIALMEISRRQTDAFFRMTIAVSRALCILEQQNAERSHVLEVVKRHEEDFIAKMDRYSLYLMLLKESQGEQFSMRLRNIAMQYKDETTIEFLEIVHDLIPIDSRENLKSTLLQMKNEIRGFDSFTWTGRG